MNSLNYYSVFKVPGEHLSQVFPPHLLKNIVETLSGNDGIQPSFLSKFWRYLNLIVLLLVRFLVNLQLV